MSHDCHDCRNLPPSERPSKPRPTDGKPRTPRCYTHLKAEQRRIKAANQARHWQKTFGLSGADYARLLAFQNGRCAICERSTGATKALAVDHDHECCPGPVSCGKCVRGLCCGPCNQMILGRYGLEPLRRAVNYLQGNNPATRLRAKGNWPVG